MEPIFKYLVCLGLLFSCASSNSKKMYEGHGENSLNAELLAKFAPTPLSPKVTGKIEKYLDITRPTMGMMSENGKNLYVNWKITGSHQIWKLKGPKSFPVQMSAGEDASWLKAVFPNGKHILISRDNRGDEHPGLYMQSTKGGELKTIYRKKNVQVFFSHISKDSKYIYYRANDVDKSSYNIYKYEVATAKRSLIFGGKKGYWILSDKLGEDILLSLWTGNTSSEYWKLNEKTKKLTPIIGQDESEEYHVQFGKNSKEFIVLTNKIGQYRRLYNLKNKKLRAIGKTLKYNISNFKILRENNKILYMTNDGGYYDFAAINLNNYKKYNFPKLKVKNKLHSYFGYSSKNNRYTTIGVETANAPRISYIYDWKKKTYTQWTYPSSPEIQTRDFAVPKLEYYQAEDGTSIPMFVRRPKKCIKQSCPVIVNFHGGPESQAQPFFSPYIQLYIDAGYVYVQPNVRGSDGYSKDWLHSDNGAKRLKVISDIRDAGLHIKKYWSYNGVTPKIAVMGGSYGGYSTLVAMTLYAGTYDRGIAIVGMSSLISFLENTAAYRRKLRVSEYGDPAKDRDALKALSPIYHLDKIKDPIMIIHGANDPRVPAGEAVQIYQQMEDKGLAGKLILFADEGHGIRKRKNRVLYIGHILEFLKELKASN
ncbi:prolyl oligopeptidase family serine peptidase [bacterium]|nr:prolyl oligopeptidase family serine peptidase [bacterium]